MTSGDPLLLDACGCINLAAAFPLESLSANLGRPIHIVEQAAAESLFLHQQISGERVKVEIDVGSIPTLRLDGSLELELYVRLAKRLGDGEAASLAVSHYRGLVLVTDDRTARKVASLEAPKAQIRGTAEILRSLTTSMALPDDAVAQAIRRVESHASFRPPHDDPDLSWWLSARELAGPSTGDTSDDRRQH